MIYLHQKASIIQNDQVILTTKLYKEKIALLPYLPIFSLLSLYVLMWYLIIN